jgi:hypothetical protein
VLWLRRSEEATQVIDGFIRVIEKLTELANYREQKRLRQFDDAVRDLYNDLQIVHTDYLRMLEKSLSLLRQGEALETVADILTQERVTHEALREEIRSLVGAHISDESWTYWNFYQLIGSYFMLGYMRPASSAMTSLRDAIVDAAEAAVVLEAADQSNAGLTARDRLISFLSRDALPSLRRSWSQLSAEYARLVKESR